jgi:hypothetical protein
MGGIWETYSKCLSKYVSKREFQKEWGNMQEDNTEISFTDVGRDKVDWIYPAQNTIQCRAPGARVSRNCLDNRAIFFISTIISNQKTYIHCFLWANALTLIGGGLGGVQRHFLRCKFDFSWRTSVRSSATWFYYLLNHFEGRHAVVFNQLILQ